MITFDCTPTGIIIAFDVMHDGRCITTRWFWLRTLGLDGVP